MIPYALQGVSTLIVIATFVRTVRVDDWRQRWRRDVDRLISQSRLAEVRPAAQKELRHHAADRILWLLAHDKYPEQFPIWKAFRSTSMLALSSIVVVAIVSAGALPGWVIITAPLLLAVAATIFIRSTLLGEADVLRWKLFQITGGDEVARVDLPPHSRSLRSIASIGASAQRNSALGSIVWCALQKQYPERNWSARVPVMNDADWICVGRALRPCHINSVLRANMWHEAYLGLP